LTEDIVSAYPLCCCSAASAEIPHPISPSNPSGDAARNMSTQPLATGSQGPEEQGNKKTKSHRFLGVFNRFTRHKDKPSDIPPQPDPSPKKSPIEVHPSQDDKPTAAEVSMRLWEAAYEALKRAEPSLVNEYEEILTRYKNGPSSTQNVLGNCEGEERLKLMKEITDKSLQKAQSRPKKETAADVTIQLIEFAREQVGALLGAYPPAALAWSGFCTITPVSRTGNVLFRTNMEGSFC
jgi:hypothetical protein